MILPQLVLSSNSVNSCIEFHARILQLYPTEGCSLRFCFFLLQIVWMLSLLEARVSRVGFLGWVVYRDSGLQILPDCFLQKLYWFTFPPVVCECLFPLAFDVFAFQKFSCLNDCEAHCVFLWIWVKFLLVIFWLPLSDCCLCAVFILLLDYLSFSHQLVQILHVSINRLKNS